MVTSLDRLHYTTSLLCWEQWPVNLTELIAFPRGLVTCVRMAVRLLSSHARVPAVIPSPASLHSSSSVGGIRRAALPSSLRNRASVSHTVSHTSGKTSSAKSAVSSSTKSAKSSSSPVPSVATDKVLCVCGVTVNDGKPMVECVECGSWSHIQCARLTIRTAKKAAFRCHCCRPSLSFARDPGRDGMGSGSTKLGKTQKSKNSQAQLHAQPIQSHSRTSHSLSPDPPPPQPAIVSSQPHSIPPIHQMNRNPPSDTCITAECDDTVMEDSGTQTSSDPHFPIVPSSARVHVQHGVHGSDTVLRSELNNIISKLKSEIRMETQARMLSLEAQVAELKQSVNNLINKCRELSQAQPSSKTSTHSRSVRSSHNESTN